MLIYLALQAIKMKKAISTYRFVLHCALIVAMLGTVCYSPLLKSDIKTVSKNETKEDGDTQSEQILTITHQVISPVSFSFESNSDLLPADFDFIHFCLPFDVVHTVVSAIFQNSYLNNIFPFAISAQAP